MDKVYCLPVRAAGHCCTFRLTTCEYYQSTVTTTEHCRCYREVHLPDQTCSPHSNIFQIQRVRNSVSSFANCQELMQELIVHLPFTGIDFLAPAPVYLQSPS